MTLDPHHSMTRRRVLSGVVVAGAAAPILAACGSGEDPESAPTTSADPTTEAPAPAPSDSASEAPGPSASAEETTSGGEVVAKSADVQVGSGFINKDAHIVVTQPTAGEYKGFTSVCTHRQCDVSNIVGDKIRCGCHESLYSIADGSVQGGPAPAPLAEIAVKLEGGNIVKA